MESQQQVWNKIAEEWHEFKQNPSEEVLKFLKEKKGKILDIGSGSGRHLQKIKNGKMYLVDFSKEMLKLAKEKSKKEKIDAEFFLSNLTILPFEDNFFDFGICIAAIHCLPKEEHEGVIREIYRVMKLNSEIIIAVWNKDSLRFKNAGKEKLVSWTNKGKRYYYLFEEKEIYNLFKKNGFKIKKKIEHGVNIIFIAEKV